jgi:copper resistance protein C
MKLAQKIGLTIVLFIAGASCAHAHAFLEAAEPKVGSTIKVSPHAVQIWFTRDIVRASQDASSNIAVFDAKGDEVDGKDSKIDPNDHALMAVSVPHLPTGTYKVVWNAVCRDSHHTMGSYTFEVANPN